jgi:hypothetical protein
MDGSRFDSWTRRRVGLAAGGIVTSLLGLTDLDGASARKKRRKRRKRKKKAGENCLKIGTSCTAGETPNCCGSLICGSFFGRTFCCKGPDESCSSPEDCCSRNCANGFCGA